MTSSDDAKRPDSTSCLTMAWAAAGWTAAGARRTGEELKTVRQTNPAPSWSVVEAKARLDDVIDESVVAGPQRLAKNGDELGVLMTADTWKIAPIGNLAEFFASAGLQEGELMIPPRRGAARDIEW